MRPRVPEALRRFIWDIQSMVELADSPREILFIGRDLMRRLVGESGWLPPEFSTHGEAPSLYELYRDEMERFSVVASVLAPGQAWPCFEDEIWEIRGVLQGRARCHQPGMATEPRLIEAGEVDTGLGQGALGLANAGPGDCVVIHVFGGEVFNRPRRVVGDDGAISEIETQRANPEGAPAYDILSIQAEIVD